MRFSFELCDDKIAQSFFAKLIYIEVRIFVFKFLSRLKFKVDDFIDQLRQSIFRILTENVESRYAFTVLVYTKS